MSQLDKLTDQRKKLDKKIAKVKARKNKESRKLETRRKILLGSILLNESKKDPAKKKLMIELIGQMNERDQKAFDDSE